MLLDGLAFPMSVKTGSTNILLHAVFETLGIFIGFRYFLWLKKRKGDAIESDNRVWILIGATAGSLIGSRLIGALENPALLAAAANKWLFVYQQKTIVGGLLGGLVGVELTKLFLKESTSSGDLFVYPLLLAMIIGRMGCFSMGVYEETYGLPTALPTGMNLGDGIRRHPVSLYEIVFLIVLWILLKQLEKRRPLANGALFKLFMMCYLLFRFCLEFIKPHISFGIGLSTIQLTCIAGLLWYFRFIVSPAKLLAFKK